MSDLVAWLTQIWDEQELIAREASRHNEEPLVEGGAHWLWACDEHDETVVPDPLTKDTLACPQDFWRVSLRSAEQYPYRSISGEGPTINFAAEEVPSSVGLHILRNDPASVLARIAADRQILALHHPDRVLENWYWLERQCAECGHRWHRWIPDTPPTVIGPETGCPTVRLLALPYADRPGFRDEWRVSP